MIIGQFGKRDEPSISAIYEENKQSAEKEDDMIVEQFWRRDEMALAAVSEKYGRYCGTIARNINSNEQFVEECVQDSLMRLWEVIPPNRPANLQAFVGTIVRNIALNAVKAMNALKRGGDVIPILDELQEITASNENSVELIAEQHETLAAINDFLGGIGAVKREIFVLRYWHCFSVSDISQIVGISEANVASILKRVRKKLLEYLKKRGY